MQAGLGVIWTLLRLLASSSFRGLFFDVKARGLEGFRAHEEWSFGGFFWSSEVFGLGFIG